MAIGIRDRQRAVKAATPEGPVAESGPVRRFVAGDIPQVADLHRRVFRVPDPGEGAHRGPGPSPRLLAAYEAYFDEVFLNGPWQDERVGSLVYDDGNGRIVGFLGVVPRPMLWNAAPVQMAICSQFVVDPQRRGKVGLQLLSEHFRGPQDLSVTDEANDATRRVWEARGGTTCPSYCIHWTRPLRPAGFALSVAGRRSGHGVIARGCAPLARAVDAVAARLPKSPFRLSARRLVGADLDEATMLKRLPDFAKGRSLRPQYDPGSLRWTLERAGLRKGGDRFHKVAVRDADRQIAGWYVYRIERSAVAEVLQIAARARSFNDVFEHLLHHAWRRGAVALSGRLDPVLFKELADKLCLYRFRGSSMLVHARKPELLQPLYRGDAFLTRLEGEWCLRFRPEW